MKPRMLLTTSLVAAAVAATATATTAAPTAIVNCGKVKAAGRTWRVEAAHFPCSKARKVVHEVAVKKPDHVIRGAEGEIDQYAGSFSGLKCVKSRQVNVGRAINCTSSDGKQFVVGIVKG